MICNTYINKSDGRCTTKNLTPVKDNVTIVLKEPCDVMNPYIELDFFDTAININYVILPALNRSYFAAPPELLDGHRVGFQLHVDVLSSNWNDLKKINCFVERQENLNSPYITDTTLPVMSSKMLDRKKIGSIGNYETFVLTVTGGVF